MKGFARNGSLVEMDRIFTSSERQQAQSHAVGLVDGLQKLLLRKVEAARSLDVHVLFADQLDVGGQLAEGTDELRLLPLHAFLVESYSVIVLLDRFQLLVVQLVVFFYVLLGQSNLFCEGSDSGVQLGFFLLQLPTLVLRGLHGLRQT